MKKFFKKILQKIFRWVMSEEIEKLNKLTRDLDFYKTNTQRTLERTQTELYTLQKEFKNITKMYEIMFENSDISIDVDNKGYRGCRSDSWAVISIQGERSDFIKFVQLKDRDIQEISYFLRQFQRGKIDADYSIRNVLMHESRFIKTRPSKTPKTRFL